MVLTHCDLEMPEEESILGKINSFKKYGQIDIPLENVIKFKNTKESLIPFIRKIKPAQMHFCENLEEKGEEILKELPNDFQR